MCSRTFRVSGTLPTCSMAPVRMRFCGIGGISAEDADFAGVGLKKTEQQLYGGGLACPIGAQERDDLTGVHGEIHIAQGANFSIVFADDFPDLPQPAPEFGVLRVLCFFESCDHVGRLRSLPLSRGVLSRYLHHGGAAGGAPVRFITKRA